MLRAIYIYLCHSLYPYFFESRLVHEVRRLTHLEIFISRHHYRMTVIVTHDLIEIKLR